MRHRTKIAYLCVLSVFFLHASTVFGEPLQDAGRCHHAVQSNDTKTEESVCYEGHIQSQNTKEVCVESYFDVQGKLVQGTFNDRYDTGLCRVNCSFFDGKTGCVNGIIVSDDRSTPCHAFQESDRVLLTNTKQIQGNGAFSQTYPSYVKMKGGKSAHYVDSACSEINAEKVGDNCYFESSTGTCLIGIVEHDGSQYICKAKTASRESIFALEKQLLQSCGS